MRNLRILLLFAIAAMTIGASTASAQGPDLEISSEPAAGGQHTHCGAVTFPGAGGETDIDGGCLLHATGELEIRKHVFGVESHLNKCKNEFTGRVDEHGEGFIQELVVLTETGSPTCNRQACKHASGETEPWVAHANEGTVLEGTENLATNLCIEPTGGGTDEHCEIDLPFNKLVNNHTYELGHATELASHGVTGFRCEIVGHWVTETGGTHDGEPEQELEVDHWTEPAL